MLVLGVTGTNTTGVTNGFVDTGVWSGGGGRGRGDTETIATSGLRPVRLIKERVCGKNDDEEIIKRQRKTR